MDSSNKEFLEAFVKSLKSIGEVLCEFYYLSRLTFIEVVEFELKVSFESLKDLWQHLSKVFFFKKKTNRFLYLSYDIDF